MPKITVAEVYQNAKNNVPSAAPASRSWRCNRVMVMLLKNDTEFFKQFVQNDSFRQHVIKMVRNLTGP